MSKNPVIAAFNEKQTERLTGVTLRQLRYWNRTGFFTPGLANGGKDTLGRVYSFRDLVSLKVLNTLRNEIKVALPHLRDVKENLAHLGDDVWANTILYILNKRVAIKNLQTHQMEDAANQQGILQIPLLVVRSDMMAAIAALQRRDGPIIGEIEKKRGVVSGKPVVAGTRIPVSTIKAYADAGYTTQQIIAEYPSLTAADIRSALAFETAA